MMNYLLALVEAEASLAARALDLDAAMGIFHVDQPHRESLSCDLMEPVRPLVDLYLLDWITTQTLKREWFFEQQNGNARLMASLAKTLSETALMWARAVAPIAEWVAQALWNSIEHKGTDLSVPTRLTQRRKTEGRGKVFATGGIPTPKRVGICEVCGVEGVQNRYCKSCAVEVSRETMAQVALIRHATPKTSKRKAQIFQKDQPSRHSDYLVVACQFATVAQ
jgi:CRISPR associated protein Cas1